MAKQQSIVFLSDQFNDLPDPNLALDEPDGLVAVSSDLHPHRLIFLYQYGFFPWYSEPDPILWWHPAQRCTLLPHNFHCSRSLQKSINKFTGEIRINQSFHEVITQCSNQRKHQEGTWISDDIIDAFSALHKQGYAHSIEVWLDKNLVGGFYGIAIGEMFFGESMFSLIPNASKYALYAFCQAAEEMKVKLIDCQVESSHLMSLGANLIPRETFIETLANYIPENTKNTQFIKTTTLSL